MSPVDPVTLEVIRGSLEAAAREMGAALARAAHSPNIKERHDHSCAIFTAHGELAAQAEHIPVHLGAMPASVEAAVEALGPLDPGDAVLLNDPYHGGTHLPDLTLVTPVHLDGERVAYVANRAHHADVGGTTPGSMGAGRARLTDEGLVLPPTRLKRGGEDVEATWDRILEATRTPRERRGDLQAQLAANHVGAERITHLAQRHGTPTLHQALRAVLDHTEERTRTALRDLPDGTYTARDVLDDDGVTPDPLPIQAEVTVDGSTVHVDLTGTAPASPGNVNAPPAVARSGAYYVLRLVTDPHVPANAGCYRPITLHAPPGSLLNPPRGHAVAAGNVETSQRVVDVLLQALAPAAPERVPAMSQGTMNNLLIGGTRADGSPYAYYETIGGGQGGGPRGGGMSGVHTHMTNTRNTPVEALEHAYPLRVTAYHLREGTGGKGKHPGGEGIRRSVQVMEGEATLSLLTERRHHAPPGLQGGAPGAVGRNTLQRDGDEEALPGKVTRTLEPGDVVVVDTPGGGGWGPPPV